MKHDPTSKNSGTQRTGRPPKRSVRTPMKLASVAMFAKVKPISTPQPQGAPVPNAISPADMDNLKNLFSHHPPKPADVEAYEAIRQAGLSMAVVILENTPPGPDQKAAINKVRAAVWTANAARACGG